MFLKKQNIGMFKSYQDYRKAWDKSPTKKPIIPINIDIELSATCNLKCPFCFLQNKEYKNKNKFMKLSLAKEIIDTVYIYGVPALKFNWRGESTIHPEFSTILEYAKSKGTFFDLLVNTNGNYDDKAVDGLMAANKVIFSLDSFNLSTYEKMRKGGNLIKVLNNIEHLIGLGHKGIVIRRVITNDNKHENFKKMAKEIFGDVETSEHYVFERSVTVKEKSRRRYCGYPSQRLIVNVKGDCFPCCVDYNETMLLGHITEPLLDIWKGNKLATLIKELKANKFTSKACQNCSSWMAYKNSKRENVKK